MKFRSIVFVIACVLQLPVVFAQANPAGAQSQAATLYQRLGGYDALAAVTDDFTGLAANYADASLRPLWRSWLFDQALPAFPGSSRP